MVCSAALSTSTGLAKGIKARAYKQEHSVKKEEIRCDRCGRLLGKGIVISFETKCPRCGAMVQITRSGKTAKL